MAGELLDELLRDFSSEERSRGIWESHWQRAAQVVLPYYVNSFYSSQPIVPGQEKNQEMYDSTANAALWKGAAAMESYLTPASGKWHRIRPIDANLKNNRVAMEWYDQVSEALFHYRYSPHAGFQFNMHEGYISTMAFGTSCMFTDAFRDPTRPGQRGLRYRHVPLGELYFATNHQGQVDKVYRKFKMTLRQIAQKWGVDKMPEGLRSRAQQKPEEEVFVLHIVRPNNDFDSKRLDKKGKRFASYYIIKDHHHMLEEGGFRCMPYSVGRYLTAPGERYGRGPAMNVLPNIRVLNKEKQIMLEQGERSARPVLLAADDGVLEGVNLQPGATNFGGVNADGRPLVHTLPVGNLAVTKEMMDDERLAINDAFLVTLFQILVETPQMTATEVLERAREKGALLSPTMGRYQSEFIGPMIEREFQLLMDQGLVPPPPPEVMEAGAEYKVEYDAPLNRAMKAEEAAGIQRSIQFAVEVAAQTQDPSPLDHFNWDVIIPDITDINGAPLKYMRSMQDIEQMREARKADQTAAQVTQALPGMAAMMKASAPEGTAMNAGQPA